MYPGITRGEVVARARSDFRSASRILSYSLGRVRYAFLAIPLLLGGLVAHLVATRRLPAIELMDPLEAAAIVILAAALAVATRRWRRRREAYFLWLTCLNAVLLLREFHFPGTSALISFAIPVFVYVTTVRYAALAEYLGSRTVLTLMAFVVTSYALSHALDRHLFAFLPQEDLFERPTEEFVEVVGHMGVLLLAILSRKADPAEVLRWDPARAEP